MSSWHVLYYHKRHAFSLTRTVTHCVFYIIDITVWNHRNVTQWVIMLIQLSQEKGQVDWKHGKACKRTVEYELGSKTNKEQVLDLETWTHIHTLRASRLPMFKWNTQEIYGSTGTGNPTPAKKTHHNNTTQRRIFTHCLHFTQYAIFYFPLSLFFFQWHWALKTELQYWASS